MFLPLSSLLHLFFGPCRTLASFRIYFQPSLSLCFSCLCYISFLQIIFNIVKLSLSCLSNRTFFFIPGHSWTLFTGISSGVLSSCPSRNNFPFLIFEVMSVLLHSSILFSVMTVCKFVAISDTCYRVSSVQIRVDDEQSFACRGFPSFLWKHISFSQSQDYLLRVIEWNLSI